MTVECACFSSPSRSLSLVRHLGMDERFGEVSILACPTCGQNWLRVHYEDEAFTASGRWYLGSITPEQAAGLDARQAAEFLEKLNWYYFGGSYFGGRSGKTSGRVF